MGGTRLLPPHLATFLPHHELCYALFDIQPIQI